MNLKTLTRFAQAAVLVVFGLIFVGGLVTSWQAGMAVPDWPLSFGSLNPEGWWANFPVRLEHDTGCSRRLSGLLLEYCAPQSGEIFVHSGSPRLPRPSYQWRPGLSVPNRG